jgi:glycosyltransferase involved in cell wall biosynthesis
MNNSNPINVLHVIDKLSMDGVNPSSCAILLDEWISCLESARFNWIVCTLRKHDPAGKLLEKKGIRVYYLEFGKFSFKNIKGIIKLLEKEKVDILHLHGYSAANFGRIASRKTGVINVVHEHAVLRTLPHQYIADLILRNFTDIGVAVSENVRDFMIRSRSIPSKRITVIRNGINIDKFRKSDDKTIEKKRRELEVPESVRIIGTVTRLRKEKGVEYFIKAMPYILKEFPDVNFLIVGDGALRTQLESLARNLSISEKIRFLGFRSDIVELLSIFDINVIPSLTEGFPLSLVEAMALGNPIVATEVGGMKEIAKDGENVLFVPPKNPLEIGEKVNFLLKNPMLSERLSISAKQLSKEFSIEKSTKLIEELYINLLKRRNKFKEA